MYSILPFEALLILSVMKRPSRFFVYVLLSVAIVAPLSWWSIGHQKGLHSNIPKMRNAVTASAPTILYFHRHGCPHCAVANPIMAELQQRYETTGWVVVEVTSSMPEDIKQMYRSWLTAVNYKVHVTPLIVVGAGSQSAAIFPGFGEEVAGREMVENAIRARLGLAPVDLGLSSIKIPLLGTWIADDETPSAVARVCGVLSGFHVLALVWFLIALISFGADKRQQTILVIAYVGSAMWAEYMGWLIYPWRGDHLTGLSVIRLVFGILLAIVSCSCLYRFVNNQTQFQRHSWWLVVIGLLLFHSIDQIMTNWTMHIQRSFADGQLVTYFGTAGLVHILLAGIPIIYVMTLKLTTRDVRLVCLLIGLFVGQAAMILLFARQFSGYGPFWN